MADPVQPPVVTPPPFLNVPSRGTKARFVKVLPPKEVPPVDPKTVRRIRGKVGAAVQKHLRFFGEDPRREFMARMEFESIYWLQEIVKNGLAYDSQQLHAIIKAVDGLGVALERYARLTKLDLKERTGAQHLLTAAAILDFAKDFQTTYNQAVDNLETVCPEEYEKLVKATEDQNRVRATPKA